MATTDAQELIREVIDANRYLTLSTTDGSEPWVATLEYVRDDEFNFYFFSTDDSRHARHIEQNPTVAFSIFDREQPEYSSDVSTNLRGVQVRASAVRLSEDEYPTLIAEAIDAFQLPMPPYSAFKLVPSTYYLPSIEEGINVRTEVESL